MSLTQVQIPETLYELEQWGTQAGYKLVRPNVSYAAMGREIKRGKIAVKFDAVDLKIKINFRQADIIFGFADSGLFE